MKESLKTEFKSDLKRLSDNDLVDAVVGMANTDGGDLYLGVEDDGQITGIQKIHADEIGVAALIANKTVPSVSVRAEIISEENTDVLKISIPMCRTIVATADGKILRRRLKLDGTPENIPMYPYEINTRLSQLSLLDFTARVMEDASMDDIDPNERIRLRKIIKMRKGDQTLLELSDDELDKALRLAKEENGILKPTVTGMLLIGREDRIADLLPTSKEYFQVLEGTEVRLNVQYQKPLLAVFEIFEEYFNAWNPEREMEYGLFRISIPEFSGSAFREGLVNAFCHRDYSILQMVRVAIDDEGLTISSPGGFIEGVNLNNLLTVEPHGRNQTLADALKRIGLAERTGRGIDRIFEGSIHFGRPWPDYTESTERCVKLFIQRAKPDMAFIKMISDEENRLGRSLPINSLLILSALKNERRLNINRIAEITHIGVNRAKANVEKLIESGLVEALGMGKAREYILSAKVYRRIENAVGYVRQSGIDSVKYPELIIKLAQNQNGYVTREDVMKLLNLGETQAYRTLAALKEQGVFVLEGTGRGAKYKLVE